MLTSWVASSTSGDPAEEMAITFDGGREWRALFLPPLYDEHNKFRRQAVEIMRRLESSGIDTMLPDLPGQNESGASMAEQSLTGWREAAVRAADQFGATHLVAVRSGALLLPADRCAFAYAPQNGARLLRSMLRARAIASREAGQEEKTQSLLSAGREDGLELAGWPLGAAMVRELEQAEYHPSPGHCVIEQGRVGGTPLWLRAEPDEDPEQADALAAILALGILDPA